MSRYTHYWRIRKWLPERFGQPCRVLATGRMGTVMIEFSDGVRHIVSRYSIRRAVNELEKGMETASGKD